jgi:hypothetical protein
MYTKWTSHLRTDDEKKRFENVVISSKPVLERMIKLIDEDLEAIEKSEIIDDFGPSWAYKQAFKNGAKSRLIAYKKLINLDEQVIKHNE